MASLRFRAVSVLTVGVPLTALCVADASASAASGNQAATWDSAWSMAQLLFDAARDWAVDGFDTAPMIMLGLALATGIPVLAVVGWLLVPGAAPATRGNAGTATPADLPDSARDALVRVDGTTAPYRISRELVRIGREADNDLCLPHATVEGYHALIRCTTDREYILVDLSGRRGRSIKVNGSTVAECHLRDGDSIEIGQQAMRFEARPIAVAAHIDRA